MTDDATLVDRLRGGGWHEAAARIAALEATILAICHADIDVKIAVLAEREACAELLPDLMPIKRFHNYRDGWIAAVAAYRAAIRARPAP